MHVLVPLTFFCLYSKWRYFDMRMRYTVYFCHTTWHCNWAFLFKTMVAEVSRIQPLICTSEVFHSKYFVLGIKYILQEKNAQSYLQFLGRKILFLISNMHCSSFAVCGDACITYISQFDWSAVEEMLFQYTAYCYCSWNPMFEPVLYSFDLVHVFWFFRNCDWVIFSL